MRRPVFLFQLHQHPFYMALGKFYFCISLYIEDKANNTYYENVKPNKSIRNQILKCVESILAQSTVPNELNSSYY